MFRIGQFRLSSRRARFLRLVTQRKITLRVFHALLDGGIVTRAMRHHATSNITTVDYRWKQLIGSATVIAGAVFRPASLASTPLARAHGRRSRLRSSCWLHHHCKQLVVCKSGLVSWDTELARMTVTNEARTVG